MNTGPFVDWLQNKLAPAANKFAGLHFIRVMTGGLWFAMPMIFTGIIFQVIGNIGMILGNLNPANPMISADLLVKITALSNMTFGLMGLFFVMGIAITGAKSRKIDFTAPLIFAVIMFFLLIKPKFEATDNLLVTNFIVDWGKFGGGSMLLAMISGYTSSEVCALFERKGWTIKAQGLPQFMAGWFRDMIPGTVLIGGTWIIVYLFNIDINAIISTGLGSIVRYSDSLPALMFMGGLGAFLFAIGIHPIALFAIIMPVMMASSAENAALLSAGVAPTLANGYHFNTLGTYLLFITVGGSGATFGLNILMMFSKVPSVKSLGKMALFPTFLNINEPLIFGCPIVFNPPLALGSILMQGIINPIFAYIIITNGWVPVPASMMIVPFFPTPLLALIMGTGLAGAFFALVGWVLSTVCWFPFFKIYEKQMIDREAAEAAQVK